MFIIETPMKYQVSFRTKTYIFTCENITFAKAT